MKKYIAGPWLRRGSQEVVTLKSRKNICDIGILDIEERESTAMLIAEAPTLLNALENLIYAAENNTGAEPSISVYHYSVDSARSAIKAAKGEPLTNFDHELLKRLFY